MNRQTSLARLLIAATLLLGGCAYLPQKPESPRVSLIGLNPVSIELFEQRYQVRLRLKNPNDFELPVRGMDFRLDINGEAFADGVSNQTLTVPPFGEEVFELEVSSNLLQVFRQLQSLQQRGAPGLAYRITGSVAVGRYGQRLPFDYSGEFAAQDRDRPDPEKGVQGVPGFPQKLWIKLWMNTRTMHFAAFNSYPALNRLKFDQSVIFKQKHIDIHVI